MFEYFEAIFQSRRRLNPFPFYFFFFCTPKIAALVSAFFFEPVCGLNSKVRVVLSGSGLFLSLLHCCGVVRGGTRRHGAEKGGGGRKEGGGGRRRVGQRTEDRGRGGVTGQRLQSVREQTAARVTSRGVARDSCCFVRHSRWVAGYSRGSWPVGRLVS